MDEDTSPRSGCLGRYEGLTVEFGRWRTVVGRSGLGASRLAEVDLVKMLQECDCPNSRLSGRAVSDYSMGLILGARGGFNCAAHCLPMAGA